MIQRRTPLKRSTKRIPQKRAKPRRGPMRDAGYLAFLREEGKCVACSWQIRNKFATLTGTAIRAAERAMQLPCEVAHGPVNGMRSKGPDNEAIPLCAAHHREMHRSGWPAFEAKYGFSRAKEAEVWYGLFWRIWKEHDA